MPEKRMQRNTAINEIIEMGNLFHALLFNFYNDFRRHNSKPHFEFGYTPTRNKAFELLGMFPDYSDAIRDSSYVNEGLASLNSDGIIELYRMFRTLADRYKLPVRNLSADAHDRIIIESTVISHEDAQLEQKYPEFASLMKEYKEGILLYELSEQKVWKKSEIDTVGLDAYYQTIKQEHLYPVRLEAELFRSVDGTVTSKAASMLKKGTSTDKLMAKLNKKNVSLLADTVTYWQGQEKAFDAIVDWSKINDESVFVNTNENELVRILKVLPPSPKPLSEVKGMIVSQYQDILEKQWIEDLHKNNTIWVDYDVILSIVLQSIALPYNIVVMLYSRTQPHLSSGISPLD